jgi:hypothetical protein
METSPPAPRRHDPFAEPLKPPATPAPAESPELQACTAAVALGSRPLSKALDAYLDKHPADPGSPDFRESIRLEGHSAAPAALRSALELAILWHQPRRPKALDRSITALAFHIAADREKDMEVLCALVRGTSLRGPEARLPWRILRPFETLPWLGRSIGGDFADDPEQVLPPPGKETIRRLPRIEREYQRLQQALEGVIRATWNLDVLSRLEIHVDRVSGAFRRQTNGPARKDVILDPRMIGGRTWATWYHGRVEEILEVISVLKGNRPLRPRELHRDAANLAVIRGATIRVLALVTTATRDRRRDAGRQYDGRQEHGHYRVECLQRTSAIAAAIYGKDLVPTPEQLKASAQKALSRQK